MTWSGCLRIKTRHTPTVPASVGHIAWRPLGSLPAMRFPRVALLWTDVPAA